MLKVYGLKTCDTCRKALKWLQEEAIAHAFVDIRTPAPSPDEVGRWASAVGWQTLLNRRGTTWRGLADSVAGDLDEAAAVRLMAAHPALMKRPVFVHGDTVLAGFTPEVRARLKAL